MTTPDKAPELPGVGRADAAAKIRRNRPHPLLDYEASDVAANEAVAAYAAAVGLPKEFANAKSLPSSLNNKLWQTRSFAASMAEVLYEEVSSERGSPQMHRKGRCLSDESLPCPLGRSPPLSPSGGVAATGEDFVLHDALHVGPLDIASSIGGADPAVVYVRLSNFAARRRGCLRLHQEAEEEDLDLEPFSPVLHPCNGNGSGFEARRKRRRSRSGSDFSQTSSTYGSSPNLQVSTGPVREVSAESTGLEELRPKDLEDSERFPPNLALERCSTWSASGRPAAGEPEEEEEIASIQRHLETMNAAAADLNAAQESLNACLKRQRSLIQLWAVVNARLARAVGSNHIAKVYEQANSLNPDRRCHFLDTFQDFLEEKYRDLLLAEATIPGPDKSFTCGMTDSSCNARIRRCRRGSPGHLRFATLRQGLRASRGEPDALEACLSHSVGRPIPKLIKQLVKYINNFGSHSWGSELFEKQKELAAEAWPKSSMGTWPVLTHIYRRRPCGVTESGRAKDLEKLAKIGASEISPFFFPEEAAACSVTLITEPSMSLAGQVMSIARDGEGTLERIFLDDQLPPEASSDVAQARFAKGTKLTVIEPMLVVSRDGLRGMAVQAGEARRLSVGMEPALARAAGNKAVASQKFAAAAELYCLGLQHPDLDLLVTILSNRCQAHLKSRDYGAAVCDAALVLQTRNDAKAWARYNQALRGLKAEHLASRVDGLLQDPLEAEVMEWRAVTKAAVKAAIDYAAQGPCNVVKPGSLVAAKRAVENAKEAANNEYKREDFVAAVEGYTRALACDPALEDAAAILGNLAHCRLCLGQPHCAIAAAVGCLRLRPAWTVAVKALHRLSAALALAGCWKMCEKSTLGELAMADESSQQFDAAIPSGDAGIETAQRQCEKLVHLRALLEGIRKGGAIDPDALCMSTPSMALDYCGPIQLKDGVRTTQKVSKGALLLLVRPLGGLSSEAESRTLQERTMQRIQHSNALCKRLSYFCSVDIATKEVAEFLRNLPSEPTQEMCIEWLLLSGQRPQLLPLLGQRHEVWSCRTPKLDGWALDGIIERYRRSFPSRKRRFGIFPALEVFHSAADVAKMANCQLVPCGEAIAVVAAEELQSEQALLLPAGFKS